MISDRLSGHICPRGEPATAGPRSAKRWPRRPPTGAYAYPLEDRAPFAALGAFIAVPPVDDLPRLTADDVTHLTSHHTSRLDQA